MEDKPFNIELEYIKNLEKLDNNAGEALAIATASPNKRIRERAYTQYRAMILEEIRQMMKSSRFRRWREKLRENYDKVKRTQLRVDPQREHNKGNCATLEGIHLELGVMQEAAGILGLEPKDEDPATIITRGKA